MISTMSNSGKVAYGITEFVCDTPEDVENLPIQGCAPGSAAIVVSTGAIYMLNNQGKWVEV